MPWFTPAFSAPQPQSQPPSVVYHTAVPAPSPARVMKLAPVSPAPVPVPEPVVKSVAPAARDQVPTTSPAPSPAPAYYSSFHSLGFSVDRSPRPSTAPSPIPVSNPAPYGTPPALQKIVYLNQRRDGTFAAALQILAEQISYQFDNETARPTHIPPTASISWMPAGASAYSDLKALAAARPPGAGMLIIVNPASKLITLTEKAP